MDVTATEILMDDYNEIVLDGTKKSAEFKSVCK